MELFGKNIHFLRKKCKFTQDHIAGYIKVTRTTWGNYENNISEPDLKKLAEIANLFGVTTDQLLYLDLTQDVTLKNHSSQNFNERQILNNGNNLTIPIQLKQDTNKGNIENEILSKLNELAENMEILKKGLL